MDLFQKIKLFLKENYIALGIAVVVYTIISIQILTGSRICDCHEKESYRNTYIHSNRFYHK